MDCTRRFSHEGRVKLKVRSLMLDAGWDVISFWEQHGDYRIHGRQWDVVSWVCHARPIDDSLKPDMTSSRGVLLSCWHTMGECAKRGICIDFDSREGWQIFPRPKC